WQRADGKHERGATISGEPPFGIGRRITRFGYGSGGPLAKQRRVLALGDVENDGFRGTVRGEILLQLLAGLRSGDADHVVSRSVVIRRAAKHAMADLLLVHLDVRLLH